MITAIFIGDGVNCSEVGQRTADRGLAHAKKESEVILCVVTKEGPGAQQQVERTLRTARADAVVLIQCLSSEIIDDASPGLHVMVNGVDIGTPEFRARSAEIAAEMLDAR